MRNARGIDCRGRQICIYVPAAGGKIQGVRIQEDLALAIKP